MSNRPWSLQTIAIDVRFDEETPDDPGTVRAEFRRGDSYAEVQLPLTERLLELADAIEVEIRERAREGLER